MNKTTRVFLKKKEDMEVSQGFPWVYDNEIAEVKWYEEDSSELKSTSLSECLVQDGSIVEVYANTGAFLGSGVINKKSKITVRLIGKEHKDKIEENIDYYFDKLVRDAVNIRALNFSPYDSCRLIFGEADFLPGLIVDRYVSDSNVYLVVQFLALATDIFRVQILNSLKNVCKPYGIYERSDDKVREKEGLPLRSGWIGAKRESKIQITENEVKLEVDFENGQKTGYFLDQKWNRERVSKLCKGKRVLDTFTHTGAFGLNAVRGGAKEVISVFISEDAIEMVNRNIALNDAASKMKAVCADVFDLLKEYGF